MYMFKVKIPKKIQIIGNLFCLVLFVYVFYQIQTRQYDDTDNLVEYAVSMHYDFKILSENENSFYNYVGMTREGKRVNFKLPKIWNLKGVCTVGDSICKVSGDSTIRVIKRTGTVFVKMNENE